MSITVPRELRPPSPRGMSPMQAALYRYFGMRVERTHREKEKGKEMECEREKENILSPAAGAPLQADPLSH